MRKRRHVDEMLNEAVRNAVRDHWRGVMDALLGDCEGCYDLAVASVEMAGMTQLEFFQAARTGVWGA